jgi:membrane protein DedA with SNARE-associated domain
VTQFLVDLIANYGLPIVVLGVGLESMGIPLPGETVLVVAAVAAAQGHLNPVAVGACGVAGAVTGDNIGYWIGRRWGRRLGTAPVVRRIYDARRMAVADRYFERHGWLTVFLGRFVALLRIFMGPLAGMHHMGWRRFVVANATGAVLWVSAVVAVGLLIGSNLDRAITLVTRAGYAGLAVAALVVVAAATRHVRRRRRERAEGERLLEEAAGEAAADRSRE